MPRIAILDDYANAALGLADWGSLPAGFEAVAFNDNLVEQDALAARLADFQVICAMRERTPFPAAMFERLPKLQLFVTSGMRNKSVDFAAARARGVVCCGTESSGTTTIEHTWALILAAARHLAHDHMVMRQGGWQTRMGFDLAGKTLGCIGLGRLGAGVARIAASAFGMKVIAWSHNLTAERCAEVGAELVSKEELFERADVATIHLVLSDRTTGLVQAADLARMKPSAILVNTSRGPIVDAAALLETLRARRIRAAALDVFDHEPLAADHPLRRLDNVVLTPHIGYVTEDTYRLFYGQMVEAITAWAGGSPIRTIEA
ncbi:MAG TPA: D-2-hydroxyacid dehydrogenase family protein [Thalassobaculum sp.]